MRFFLPSFLYFLTLSLYGVMPPPFQNKHIENRLIKIPKKTEESNLGGVDRIYYINLSNQKARNSKLQRNLRDLGINADRVEGFYGHNLSKKEYRKIVGKTNFDPEMTYGAVGCAISHFSIWKDAMENDYNTVWILEDDIEFWEPPEKISEMIVRLNQIDPEWDVFFTDPDTRTWDGTFFRKPNLPPDNNPKIPVKGEDYYFTRESIDEDLERIYLRIGAYSMLVSDRGIKKFMEFHTRHNLWTHVDVSIHMIPGIREYVAKTPLVTHTIEDRSSDTEPR